MHNALATVTLATFATDGGLKRRDPAATGSLGGGHTKANGQSDASVADIERFANCGCRWPDLPEPCPVCASQMAAAFLRAGWRA